MQSLCLHIYNTAKIIKTFATMALGTVAYPTLAVFVGTAAVFGFEVAGAELFDVNMYGAAGTGAATLLLFTALLWKVCYKSCATELKPFFACNTVAGAFHILSAVVILSLGLPEWKSHNRSVSAKLFEVTRWKFSCYNRKQSKYNFNDKSCNDEDRLFYPDTFENELGQVHVILFCTVFSAWSGFVHLARAAVISTIPADKVDFNEPAQNNSKHAFDRRLFWNTETFVRFGIDYSVSASIMFVTFAVLFAATNVASVIIAPSILTMLLWLSVLYLNTYRRVRTDNVQTPTAQTTDVGSIGFWALICAYVAIVTGTILHSVLEITNVASNTDYGEAPAKVLAVSTAITLFVFSSFIIPYFIELKGMPRFSKSTYDLKWQLTFTAIYSCLSLLAKVTLHVLFTVSGLQQSKILANNTDVEPPNARDQLKWIAIGSSTVISTSVVIFIIVYRIFIRPVLKQQTTSPTTTKTQQANASRANLKF